MPVLVWNHLKKNYVFDLVNCRSELIQAICPNSRFQWYNVAELWRDVCTVVKARLKVCNLFPEPLETSVLLDMCFPHLRELKSSPNPPCYDIRTKHSSSFGGPQGYIRSAKDILHQLVAFCTTYRCSPLCQVFPAPLTTVFPGRLTISWAAGHKEDQALPCLWPLECP